MLRKPNTVIRIQASGDYILFTKFKKESSFNTCSKCILFRRCGCETTECIAKSMSNKEFYYIPTYSTYFKR